MQERLQKFLARSGVASRRKAEEMIVRGLVHVNGAVVSILGTSIDSEVDIVEVGGKRVMPPQAFRYIAVNKPVGYVCTRAKIMGEKSVYDLVPNSRDLVIAGRLDKDSEGLVLLTNDGEFVNRLTHPRYKHKKEYEVETSNIISDANLDALRNGIRLDEGLAVADHVARINEKMIRLVLHQGWNRQVRRMMGALGCRVLSLRRVRIEKLPLDNIALGKFKVVARSDINPL